MTDKIRNVVNGELTDAASGETYDVVNPSTGQTYASAPASGAEDIDRAYKAAETAFETWRNTTPSERQRALLKIADALEERTAEFVKIESENTGKPLGVTEAEEMPPAIDQIRFFAGAARVLEGKSAGEYMADHTLFFAAAARVRGGRSAGEYRAAPPSFVRREPIGVVGQVTPWNYPLMMAIWKIGPALAAGNTVVLKPSDTTPVSTLLLAELAAEFLPRGVLNVVTGDRTTGSALVSHLTPAMVAITGSIRAGIQVAVAAAADVKRVHLELGGKAPVIVFD